MISPARLPRNHFRCVSSMRNGYFPALILCFIYRLSLEQAAEKFQRVHAMRGIMRARIHATRFLMIQAEVARCGFYLHAGNPSSGIRRIVQLNGERMHIDISVWTIVGALATTDAPVFDDHLERIAAANRPDRTAHHAQRIAALPARSRDQYRSNRSPSRIRRLTPSWASAQARTH